MSQEALHENDGEQVSRSETSVYDNVRLTEMKEDIIEYIAQHPEATNRTVSEAVDCSMSYPSRVKDQYGDLIYERAKELGSDLSKLEDSLERQQKKRASSWDSLSQKQKEVLARLALEDDPKNPSVSLRQIVEDLSFDTYPAYVSDVKQKYGDFAVRFKHAKEIAGEDEDPVSLIDTVTIEDGVVKQESQDETVEEETSVDSTTSEVDEAVEDMEGIEEELSDSTLRELESLAESHRELAEEELEYDAENKVAVGRLIMATVFENKLKAL